MCDDVTKILANFIVNIGVKCTEFTMHRFNFQDLVTHKAEYDLLKRNVDVMRQLIVQNHQDLASLLTAMHTLTTDVGSLVQACNQSTGLKIRKERKRAARSGDKAVTSGHVTESIDYPDFEAMKECERIVAAAAITADAVTGTGRRSLSTPGVVPSESQGQSSSKFHFMKNRLSFRRSQPTAKPENI